MARGNMPSYLARQPMEVVPVGAKAWPEMMSRERRAMAGFGGAVMSVTQRWQAERDNAEVSRLQSTINNFQYTSLRQLEDDWRAGKFTNADQFKQAEDDYVKARDRMVSKLIKGKRGIIGDRVSEYAEQNKASDTAGFYRNLFPKEKEFRSVEALKVIENYKVQGDRNKALMAIEQNKYWLGLTKSETLKANLDADIESNKIQSLINIDPEAAMKAIDALDISIFDEGKKNQLRSQARAGIARRQREQAIAQQVMREQINNTMLVDFWEGNLTDPQKVTDAFSMGYLDEIDAKYLRNAIMNPNPSVLRLQNLAIVKQAIDDIGTNTITKEQALSVLYENLDSLDPATGKTLLNEIFTEQDKNKSEMKRESRSLMEELVRDRDEISGMFSDDERQILGAAEAYLMLDAEIKKAVEEGKPLGRRDIMIKAIQIGRQMKKKIKDEEKADVEPFFEPTRAEEMAEFEKRLEKEKYYKYKPSYRRNPKFEMAGEEPEKAFNEKGEEIGLRIVGGTVFKINDKANINGVIYEYTGSGNWKRIGRAE